MRRDALIGKNPSQVDLVLLDFLYLVGGLQRCSDVFPVSRCLFALRHYDAGGKRTLEGAERLAVTARTISEYGTSALK